MLGGASVGKEGGKEGCGGVSYGVEGVPGMCEWMRG